MFARWHFAAYVVVIALGAALFFVLKYLGLPSVDAQVYSAAVTALAGSTVLWWQSQEVVGPDEPHRLSTFRKIMSCITIAVIGFLIETVTSEVAFDIVGVVLSTAKSSAVDATLARELVNRYFAIPIGLILLAVMGYYSARFMPVRRPLGWLAASVLIWYGARFSIYPIALAMAPSVHVALPPLGDAIIHTLAVASLSYAALIIGNIFGRRRYRRRAKSTDNPDQTGNRS